LFLPTDSSAQVGEELVLLYNKVELFDIDDGNGSFSNTTITLPSEDILEGNDLLSSVTSSFLAEDNVYVKYIAAISEICPATSLSSFPINGSGTSNGLFDSSLTSITGSNSPVFFTYDSDLNAIDISRFGPSQLSVEVTGTVKPGKLKISGTTLERIDLLVTAGLSINGLTFDIESEIKEALGLTTLPNSIFVARVDSVVGIDSPDAIYDLTGQGLRNNTYSFGTSDLDETLELYEFTLPSTANNSAIALTSGETVMISLLLGDSNGSELLYFGGDSEVISDKRFARIDSVSVSSGFRSSTGVLVGTGVISPANQPDEGLIYNAVYDFKAPKEGERITVRYNLNKLVTTVTSNIEIVRPITADVLIKEAFEIEVDVTGESIVGDDAATVIMSE